MMDRSRISTYEFDSLGRIIRVITGSGEMVLMPMTDMIYN